MLKILIMIKMMLGLKSKSCYHYIITIYITNLIGANIYYILLEIFQCALFNIS